jgi:putative oxygen-independent coproporphyrinogen III oxidase
MEDWQQGGFGLYIHWPYCQSKCPYCDFNSHVATHIDQNRWKSSYLSEIERCGSETKGRILNSVFFGGGTPSLMEPEVVDAVIDKIRRTWPTSNDLEITLEANPGSVEAGRFAGFRQAGVNRISMGIQALNDLDLKQLGRLHSVAEAKAAFEIARAQFERVSFDLIYARQGQSLQDWRSELSEAVAMAVDHLSLYQLTVEDGTAFGDRFSAGKLNGLPGEDLAADMYETTQDICSGAGYEAYEVSNHAKPGAFSKHNLIYWSAGDYLGIGPGAHGRLTLNGQRYATEAPKSPNHWLDLIETNQMPESRELITESGQGIEYLMMGLRVLEGISLSRYKAMSGADLPPSKLDALIDLGVIHITGDRLRTTQRGRLILNAVISELCT